MSTKQSIADLLVEQMAEAGAVSARKMFGEYAIYCDGILAALICDDQLYVKQTPAGRAMVGGGVVEGAPYPGAKPCFVIDAERWDDRDWLATLIRVTTAELPVAKKRRAKSR